MSITNIDSILSHPDLDKFWYEVLIFQTLISPFELKNAITEIKFVADAISCQIQCVFEISTKNI